MVDVRVCRNPLSDMDEESIGGRIGLMAWVTFEESRVEVTECVR
jgi:hypothetical protein